VGRPFLQFDHLAHLALLMLRITFPLLSAVDAEIVDKLHFGGFESKKGGPSSEGAADVSTSFLFSQLCSFLPSPGAVSARCRLPSCASHRCGSPGR
jgi:hypothetical protein